MLEGASGVSASKDGFAMEDGGRLSIYVGRGDSLVIGNVVGVSLDDSFAVFASKEDDTTYMVAYENLLAISVQPPTGAESRRTGFS